jgi:hypothetical protein
MSLSVGTWLGSAQMSALHNRIGSIEVEYRNDRPVGCYSYMADGTSTSPSDAEQTLYFANSVRFNGNPSGNYSLDAAVTIADKGTVNAVCGRAGTIPSLTSAPQLDMEHATLLSRNFQCKSGGKRTPRKVLSKRLSIEECGARVLADAFCGNIFFGRDGHCVCLGLGSVCESIRSRAGNSIYQVKELGLDSEPESEPASLKHATLVLADVYCKATNTQRKLVSNELSIDQCSAAVKADSFCGGRFYASDSKCMCIAEGALCEIESTSDGFSIYDVNEADTLPDEEPAPEQEQESTIEPEPEPNPELVNCSPGNFRRGKCERICGPNGGAAACKYKQITRKCVNRRTFVDNLTPKAACSSYKFKEAECNAATGPNGGAEACKFKADKRKANYGNCVNNRNFVDNRA